MRLLVRVDSDPNSFGGSAGRSSDEAAAWPSFLVDARLKVIVSNRGDGAAGSEDIADALLREGVPLAAVGETLDRLEEGEEGREGRLSWEGSGMRISIRVVPSATQWRQVSIMPVDASGHAALAESQKRLLAKAKELGLKGDDGSRRGISALVVDDAEVSIELLSRLLRKLGCSVIGARSGGEALALCSRRDFDLVFMDVQMPGIGGIEATRMLRQRSIARGVPPPRVIGVSAGAGSETEAAALAAGMAALRDKPLSFSFLQQCVNALGRERAEFAPASSTPQAEQSQTQSESLPILGSDGWAGDADLRRHVVRLFARDGSDELMRMERLAREGATSALSARIHAFKGGADVVQASRLSAACHAALESLRGEAPDAAAASLVQRIRGEFEAFAQEAERQGLGQE